MSAQTGKTSFFSTNGILDRAETRFGSKGEYGYAHLRIIDRSSGRETRRTLLAFGAVFDAMKDAWYDGSKGRFAVANRTNSLVATGFEPA